MNSGLTVTGGATALNSSLSVASQATFNGNGETLSLKGSGGSPHTYIGFYPGGPTSSRSGYFGFGGHNTATLSLVNQYSNGDITLGNHTNITGTLNMFNNRIINVLNPTSNQDAATKKYVDDNVGDVNGTFRATGATTLSSTLGVSGATTLSSTLGVSGSTTLSSTLGVSGSTTLSSTLGVSGATTLSSTLNVTGNTTIDGNLIIYDDITSVNGNVIGGGGIRLEQNFLDMNDLPIVNVADPTSDQDAATKKYVDDNAGGGFNNITESGSVTTITGETVFVPPGGGNQSHFNYTPTGDTHIRSKSSSDYVYIQDSGGNTQIGPNGSGYLGIGRNPSYNLDVNGNARFSGATTHSGGLLVENNNSFAPGSNYNKLRWTSNNSGTFAYTSMDYYQNRARSSVYYVSLRCNGRALFRDGIWYPRSAKESDRRIKRDIQPVEFEETLKIIRETPLRKYTYIDPKNISSEVHHGYRTYGFIAQELEEAFPLAVDTSSRFIPNIFSFYSDNEDFLQEEDKKPIRCEYVTENNNLLLKVPSLRKKLTETEKLIDYCRIIVKETILKEEDEKELEIFKEDADYTYFKVEKQYYWVFIYGFMVSDFKSIDTDDVMFLHHKAIQDIDNVQQAEKTKVGTLETQNTELLSKINNLETENTQLKDKVTDLENQIKAIKEHLGI